MFVFAHLRRPAAGLLFLGFLWGSSAAQTVFVADQSGNVGRYDVGMGTTAPVGNLTSSGFSVGQVIGITFDSKTNSILLLDRNGGGAVYAMNATTGVSTLLFNPGFSFQGGALVGSTLYGVDENGQTLEAFSLAGANLNISGPSFSAHIHGLGVIPSSGQLVILQDGQGVYAVNNDGTTGARLLTTTSLFAEDLEYYNGDYLVANATSEVFLVNGTTGAQSVFLTTAQAATMGVSSIVGVTTTFASVPEPGTAFLLGSGLIVLLWGARRRSGAIVSRE